MTREAVRLILTEAGRKARLDGAHVIEASPGIGASALIALNYLVENLKPVKLAEIRSQHFPHVSVVDEGIASAPKIEIYLHEADAIKLVLISRNFPIESSEGGYALAVKLYEFLAERGALSYYLLSSSRITGERGIYVASLNPEDAKPFLNSGARVLTSLDNIPADKFSSYMLMLYLRRTGRVCILISEAVSYFPDPLSAKDLLSVLSRALKFKVDLEKLEEEIEKHRRILEEVQRGYERMIQRREERPGKEPFYIG